AEWLDTEEYTDFLQAKERISQIINIYNKVRGHASCNMLTPMEAELHRGKLGKKMAKKKTRTKRNKNNTFTNRFVNLCRIYFFY
ncbi:hypothetical protein EZS27_043650, partial [termite gut metagenome]